MSCSWLPRAVPTTLPGCTRRWLPPVRWGCSGVEKPPPPADHDTVLYVRRDPGALRAHFADASTVGDIGEDMHAYLLTGQRQSWDQVWPQVRTVAVS